MKLVYIFLYLIFSLHVEPNEAKCLKNTVAVQNNLTLSRSILKVHCESRDDDLGEHSLEFQGIAYSFSFHDNVILFTRFKCILRKGASLEYHKDFVAYEGAVSRGCGLLYIWEARDEAIYLSKNGEPMKLIIGIICPKTKENMEKNAKNSATGKCVGYVERLICPDYPSTKAIFLSYRAQ
ncbi:hypothetical protein Bca101_040006 [Brassica carinata]